LLVSIGASDRFAEGSSKQQQIPIRIFDDEILGAPRLLFQCLVKGNPGGLKFKEAQTTLLVADSRTADPTYVPAQ
jgi:hypothetical protein